MKNRVVYESLYDCALEKPFLKEALTLNFNYDWSYFTLMPK